MALFVVYCPKLEELKIIREMAANFDGDQNKFAWLNWANDEDLPHLKKDSAFKSVNTWEFEIPQEDLDLLVERVTLAEIELKKLLK